MTVHIASCMFAGESFSLAGEGEGLDDSSYC